VSTAPPPAELGSRFGARLRVSVTDWRIPAGTALQCDTPLVRRARRLDSERGAAEGSDLCGREEEVNWRLVDENWGGWRYGSDLLFLVAFDGRVEVWIWYPSVVG